MLKYNRQFYLDAGEGSARSAAAIVPIVLELIQPLSVVDVGCGVGWWLAECARLGVPQVFGVDGPWVSPELLRVPRSQFFEADLTEPISVGRTFDLVISVEVAEHIAPESAETFVRSLTGLGSTVLFSAAVPFQGGRNHVNEQWPSYWVRLFAQQGFQSIDCIRPRIWNSREVEWWYAQNIFVAIDETALSRWPRMGELSRQTSSAVLDVIHPRLFLQSTAWAKPAFELFQASLGAVRDRVLGRRRGAR